MSGKPSSISDLEERIRELGAGFSGKWTLALTDLATGEHVGISEDDPMPTASVIKLPVLIAVHHAVHDGRLALDQRVTYGSQHRSIGSGVLAQLSFGVEMSLRDAAVLMAIVSDNTATNVCIDTLGGIERVNETMRSQGFEATTMFTRLGDPSRGLNGRDHYLMTARETCRMLELIARRELISPDACDDMLRILRRQQLREKLTRHLPWNELNTLPDPRKQWVASKGGTYLFGVRNDCAIMHNDGREAALAVFTEGGKVEGRAANSEGDLFLAEVGRTVWEWLSG